MTDKDIREREMNTDIMTKICSRLDNGTREKERERDPNGTTITEREPQSEV